MKYKIAKDVLKISQYLKRLKAEDFDLKEKDREVLFNKEINKLSDRDLQKMHDGDMQPTIDYLVMLDENGQYNDLIADIDTATKERDTQEADILLKKYYDKIDELKRNSYKRKNNNE